ncbi:hypothetical protein COD67_16340 [Bacillus cereus]|nr:hypothetical protein COI89_02815 [Bacillus cereus]PGU65285.1 hypothetical protein COD67_16340 [Bacillus cereus]
MYPSVEQKRVITKTMGCLLGVRNNPPLQTAR